MCFSYFAKLVNLPVLPQGFTKNENKSWERSQHVPAQLSLQLPTADPIMLLFLSHIYFFTHLITEWCDMQKARETFLQ